MKKPVLVVMAAGMGSRYGGLKQLDPVGGHGQLIIDYSVYDARRAGFETVIFIIKREDEAAFRAAIGDRLSRVMEVHYAYQSLTDLPEGYSLPEGRGKPWGTTHAVLAAREQIHAPFAVINSDDYYGSDAFRQIYAFLSENRRETEYAMVSYRLGNTVTAHGGVTRGLCTVDDAGYLTGITECRGIERDGENARMPVDGRWVTLPAATVVSMNFWGFPCGFLEEAQRMFPAFLAQEAARNPLNSEFLLPATVGELVTQQRVRVRVLHSSEQWYGVTYREDRDHVVQAMRTLTEQGYYPENLWQ